MSFRNDRWKRKPLENICRKLYAITTSPSRMIVWPKLLTTCNLDSVVVVWMDLPTGRPEFRSPAALHTVPYRWTDLRNLSATVQMMPNSQPIRKDACPWSSRRCPITSGIWHQPPFHSPWFRSWPLCWHVALPIRLKSTTKSSNQLSLWLI